MSNFGEVSGKITGSKKFLGPVSFAQGAAGIGVQVIKDSQIWYVDSGKTSPAVSGDGLTWDAAFLTIAEALTAAGENDVIYIAPGDYEISAALAITSSHHGLTIIGPNRSCNDYKCLIYSDAAMNLFDVDANNVTIIGVGLSAAGGNGHGIAIAGTTASYKLHIENCRLDGWGNTGYAIKCDDTQDQPDLTVINCLMRSWATGGIYHNATRGMYKGNTIWVDASAIGINCVQTGGNRPDTLVADNRIIGSNSGDTGIKIAATEPTDGTLMVVNNDVTNCATLITQDKSDAGLVNNGTYGDSAAPVIVDPNS